MLRLLGAILMLISFAVAATDDLDFESALEEAQYLIDSGEVNKEISDAEKKAESFNGYSVPEVKNITNVEPIDLEDIPFERIENERKKITESMAEKRINLLVFISSSMPEQTIKNIMVNTEKIGGTLLLQGFVGGDFNHTRQWLLDILGEDVDSALNPNIAIDPTGFERFDITAVPVYMAIAGNLPGCTEEQCLIPEHILLSGNVEVPWALRKLGDGKPEWQSQLYNLAVTAESF